MNRKLAIRLLFSALSIFWLAASASGNPCDIPSELSTLHAEINTVYRTASSMKKLYVPYNAKTMVIIRDLLAKKTCYRATDNCQELSGGMTKLRDNLELVIKEIKAYWSAELSFKRYGVDRREVIAGQMDVAKRKVDELNRSFPQLFDHIISRLNTLPEKADCERSVTVNQVGLARSSSQQRQGSFSSQRKVL